MVGSQLADHDYLYSVDEATEEEMVMESGDPAWFPSAEEIEETNSDDDLSDEEIGL